MLTVWKYPLPVEDTFDLDMPRGVTPLKVDTQHGQGNLWALVDPEKPLCNYTFHTLGTGHKREELGRYIGSYQLQDGFFVAHIFQSSEDF